MRYVNRGHADAIEKGCRVKHSQQARNERQIPIQLNYKFSKIDVVLYKDI